MLKPFLDQEQKGEPSLLCSLSGIGFCMLWLSLLSFVISFGSYVPCWHFMEHSHLSKMGTLHTAMSESCTLFPIKCSFSQPSIYFLLG